MTHWIVEYMQYDMHADQFSHNMHHAGIRLSCDGGKSWIVAGSVQLREHDRFETRQRFVTLPEYIHRCANAKRSLTFTVHPNMRSRQ